MPGPRFAAALAVGAASMGAGGRAGRDGEGVVLGRARGAGGSQGGPRGSCSGCCGCCGGAGTSRLGYGVVGGDALGPRAPRGGLRVLDRLDRRLGYVFFHRSASISAGEQSSQRCHAQI